MQQLDSEYLKRTVGNLLAKGLAQTMEQQPKDPVEYLAMYLLHEVQLEQVQQRRKKQLEEHNKELADKQESYEDFINKSATTIQTFVRTEMSRLNAKREAQQKEDELLLAKIEQDTQELMTFKENINVEAEGKEPEVVVAEKLMIFATEKLKRHSSIIQQLDSDKIKVLKSSKKYLPMTAKLLKTLLLFLDVPHLQLKNWKGVQSQITANMKESLLQYDITKPQKVSKWKRIAIMQGRIDETQLKEELAAGYMLLKWFQSVVEYRDASIEDKKAKKQELTDEPEAEGESPDVTEEIDELQ